MFSWPASLFSGITTLDQTIWTAIRSWSSKLIVVALWMAASAICGEAKAAEPQATAAFQDSHAVAYVSAIIGALVVLWLLDYLIPILRDHPVPKLVHPVPDSEHPAPGSDKEDKSDGRQPYSLGRCQMAFWTAVVIVSAVYLYLVKGAAPGTNIEFINGTAAILIGISGATGLTSSFVDSSKDQKRTTANEKNEPEEQIDELTRTNETEGFLIDILEDDNGNSLHRVQMVIFTLTLGAIFCAEVINKGAMPTFSEATLGLIGIASGVYVGFKIPGGSVSTASSHK